uniref:Uncharacterized protein n=1 Tax=Glossina palpalis gambiensis TaxID=67801 RepID=A0A1B0C3K3_9MUSC
MATSAMDNPEKICNKIRFSGPNPWLQPTDLAENGNLMHTTHKICKGVAQLACNILVEQSSLSGQLTDGQK